MQNYKGKGEKCQIDKKKQRKKRKEEEEGLKVPNMSLFVFKNYENFCPYRI